MSVAFGGFLFISVFSVQVINKTNKFQSLSLMLLVVFTPNICYFLGDSPSFEIIGAGTLIISSQIAEATVHTRNSSLERK